ELGVDDVVLVIHLDLQLHDVAALRRADDAGADVLGLAIKRPYVARVLEVIDYLATICHLHTPGRVRSDERVNARPIPPCAGQYPPAPSRTTGSSPAVCAPC